MVESDVYVLQQAIMKIDSFIQDVCELKDDDSDNRESLEAIAENATIMEAMLINVYKAKTGDDELLQEVKMEEIDKFPFDGSDESNDFMNDEIL